MSDFFKSKKSQGENVSHLQQCTLNFNLVNLIIQIDFLLLHKMSSENLFQNLVPNFLENCEKYDLGITSENEIVNDVKLPK